MRGKLKQDKRGITGNVERLIGIVVLFVLVAQLAPTALVGLFNSTAFTGVPAWVSLTLGIIGVVGFIFLMLRANSKK